MTDTDKIPLSTEEIEKLETQWKHSYFSMGNTWCGAVIEEGLKDKDFLEHLKEIKVIYTGKDKTQKDPNEWHIHIILVPYFMIKNIMSELTTNFYAHFKNLTSQKTIVIWKDKWFNCTTNKKSWKNFQEYGKSIGLKEDQLDLDIDMVTLSEDEIKEFKEFKEREEENKRIEQEKTDEQTRKKLLIDSEMWIRYFNRIIDDLWGYNSLEELQNQTDQLETEFMVRGLKNLVPKDFIKIENRTNKDIIDIILSYIIKKLYDEDVIKTAYYTEEDYQNLKQFLYRRYYGIVRILIDFALHPNDKIPDGGYWHISANTQGFLKSCGDCLNKELLISVVHEDFVKDDRYWMTFNLIIRRYYEVNRPDLLNGYSACSRFYDKEKQRSSFIESFHSWRVYKDGGAGVTGNEIL